MSAVPSWLVSGFFRCYYPYTGLLNRLFPSPKINERPFTVLPSVCKPLGNEQTVVDHMPAGKNVLELGCGSGIITIYAALKSAHVTAVDISPDAVRNTALNVAAQGLENVTVKESNGFENVSGRFDVVISNPPWIDFDLNDPNKQWATSATLIPSLFRDSGRFLVDDGLLIISCPGAAKEHLEKLGSVNGFTLESTHKREKNGGFRVRALTLLYLQVGFHPLVYVFRRQGSAAA